MDIVLNTTFSNPNLPVVPVPGFVDDFERPAADTMGETLDGKPWHNISASSSAVWGTFGDGTAGMKSSGSQYHTTTVDASAPNGTLSATLASANGRRPGLALRLQDNQNLIYAAPISSTDHRIRLAKRVNGSTTTSSQLGAELHPGDTVSVTLNGPNITVSINNVVTIDENFPELTGATRHGLYAFSGVEGTWSHIEFVAD